MTFRHDINGLRAWAVIAVLLFHFEIPGAKGGFAGVDVFFVISGYLMTEIIFQRWHNASFSIIGFYLDRARRIIPALGILCVALLAIGWFYIPSHDYIKIGEHVWGSAGFFSNHLYLGESGYFEKNSLTGKWLQHTWSLSVEWQFYLLYPLLVFLACRLVSLANARYILAACGFLSLAYGIWLTMHSADTAFYLLSTRLWELLAGALVCLFPLRTTERWKKILELAGFALLLYSFNQMSGAQWPGWQALFPVCGTVLILVAAQQSSWLTGNVIMQSIGTISYSLYLWHWPIAHWLDKSGALKNSSFVAIGLLMALLLSICSWRLVEKPFQKRYRTTNILSSARDKYALAALLLFSLLVSLWGYGVWQQKGFPDRPFDVEQRLQDDFLGKYEAIRANIGSHYRFECGFYDEEKQRHRDSIDPACTHLTHNNIIFLWGDSHAQALSEGLRTLAGDQFSVAQVATALCNPLIGKSSGILPIDNNCDLSNQFALQEITRLKPHTVVLAQEHSHELTDWDAMAKTLKQLGVGQVILVGPVPQWYPSLPTIIMARYRNSDALVIEDKGLVLEMLSTNELLHQRYDGSSLLRHVSLVDALCKNKTCQVKLAEDGELLSFDYGHLTPKASIYVVRLALGQLLVPGPSTSRPPNS